MCYIHRSELHSLDRHKRVQSLMHTLTQLLVPFPLINSFTFIIRMHTAWRSPLHTEPKQIYSYTSNSNTKILDLSRRQLRWCTCVFQKQNASHQMHIFRMRNTSDGDKVCRYGRRRCTFAHSTSTPLHTVVYAFC